MSRRWKTRLATLSIATTAISLGLISPAWALPALSNVSWSISNPHPGDTGVRYTWSFTTPSGGTISAVTFTVPNGTGVPGVLTPVDMYGLTGGTAAWNGGTNTVTYTVTSPSVIPAGTPILISIDGFTNTSTANTAYTSTATTVIGGVNTDTGASSAVGINNNTTAVTVVVGRSTSFTSDTTGFSLLMDPSVAALTDQTHAVNLTVATNAANGYTLNTKVNRVLTGATHATSTVPAISTGIASGVASGAFTTDRFGYSMSVGGGSVGTLQSVPLQSGSYVGYQTGAGENPVVAGGPTNNDTVTITNRAKIDYQQNADVYTATVTYTVIPSY
jgi:hypothetical protein